MNSPAVAGDIWYVDGGVASCSNNGASWANAFKYLQDALAIADGVNEDEVWVAAGTYYPDEDCANTSGTGDWNDTFNMIDGVAILGGFDGTEDFAEDRDPVTNVTILSGDIEGPGPSGCGTGDCYTANGTPGCDNANICDYICTVFDGLLAYCCNDTWDIVCAAQAISSFPHHNTLHVLTANDVSATSIIDGFTITKGWCHGGVTAAAGAGMIIFEASPTVVRCIFDDNVASNGGCVAIQGGSGTSDPLFINCEFKNSQAFCYGAGMFVNGNASATVVNSVFSKNTSISDLYAGSGFAAISTDSSGELINCVFVGNESGTGGGGGAGVTCLDGSVVMDNCIFWDNDPNQISIGLGGTVDVNYSCIQDGWFGTGNISTNPLFVDLDGGDYRLKPTSPCVDTGNPDDDIITDDILDLDNDSDTSEPTPDLDLNNRVSSRDNDCEKIVDMGVYEVLEGCCPWDLNGDGAVSTLDILELFAVWGSDPGGPPDFDCSGAVGTSDLLELFANWGACDPTCGPSSTPLSFEDELDDACITEAEWDEYEDIMQTGTEEEKENYDCWMRHWIEDCDRCSCLGESGCPGEDPFG